MCLRAMYTLLFIHMRKKLDFYKRKLKLADLLCLLQCVVCLRRVIIVLNMVNQNSLPGRLCIIQYRCFDTLIFTVTLHVNFKYYLTLFPDRDLH